MNSNPEDIAQFEKSISTLKGMLLKLTGRPRVLIVEDDPNDKFIFEREIRKFQCVYEFAEDGQEAIQKIASGSYDFVFLDMLMPKVGGSQVLQSTTNLKNGARVIIVTGQSDAPWMPEALRGGADMALGKPISFEKLKLFLTPI